MIYLLNESLENEIHARCEYLYDIFHLYFLPQKKTDGFIPLAPLGAAGPSIMFIVGHQDKVYNYLNAHIDYHPEDILVLITCMPQSFRKFKRKKSRIYTSSCNNNISFTYNGNQYGFNFNITKSELDFYNSSPSQLLQRLDNSFDQI